MKVFTDSGLSFAIDDEDWQEVSKFYWDCTPPCRKTPKWRVRGSAPERELARFLLKPPAGSQVDHIDGDPLNNCRSNLRLASPRQNSQNKTKYASNKTGFKGVSYDRFHARYSAKIKVNGKQIHLGYYFSAEAAHEAYKAAAVAHHGAFARF